MMPFFRNKETCSKHNLKFIIKPMNTEASSIFPETKNWKLPIELRGILIKYCPECAKDNNDPEIVDGEIIQDHIDRLRTLANPITTTLYKNLHAILDYSNHSSGPEEKGSDSVRNTEPSNVSFHVEAPHACVKDLILDHPVQEQVRRALARVRNYNLVYIDWGLSEVDPMTPGVAINIFGPPGTGKTMVAEAMAKELGMSLIRVPYASVESKYVGETSKNIVAAFESARISGSLLLFDEADSILGKRLDNVSQSADHAVNVSRSTMLIQLERFEGVVVFTTNKLPNYDEAFLRRIACHFEMPLPNEDARKMFFMRFLPARVPQSDIDFNILARESDGLSGAEIKQVVFGALTDFADSIRKNESAKLNTPMILAAVISFKQAKSAAKTNPRTLPFVMQDTPIAATTQNETSNISKETPNELVK